MKMTRNNEMALTRALSTLREVTRDLTHGVNKADFEQRYRDKWVSPGISVRRHVEIMRVSGSLEETATTMKLKPKNALVAA